MICTFTEKAAFELRDRISAAARKVGYSGDLTELRVSTIHSLCHGLLAVHRHRTVLGNNFETLDELTQLLFIFDNFAEIIGPDSGGTYLTQWKTKWTAIKGAQSYFDKITEELIDPDKLVSSGPPRRIRLGDRECLQAVCRDLARQQPARFRASAKARFRVAVRSSHR